MAEYERLTAADAAGADDTTTAADPAAGEADAQAAAEVEVRPRPPRGSAPGAGLAARLRARQGGSGRKGRGKASRPRSGKQGAAQARPRVSVEGVITWIWAASSRAAAPVSENLSKCLGMQAPVAGLVLEDQVRGTVVDRVLQPLARGQARLEGVGALFAMPAVIGALEACEGYPEPKRSIRRAFLIPLATEAAAMWIRVAGPKVQERIERDRELGPVYEQANNLLVMMDFPFLTAADLGLGADAPYPPNGQAQSPEDAAAQAAQRFAQP
jgi:hypothetical protein